MRFSGARRLLDWRCIRWSEALPWQARSTADFAEHNALGAAGLGVLLATLVHKPADALTISTLMVRGGSVRWLVHLVNLGFGLMIPAGVALFVVGSSGFTAGCSVVDHRGSIGVLGRNVSLHRPIRPSTRTPIPLARPAEIVAGTAGRSGPDGSDGIRLALRRSGPSLTHRCKPRATR